MLDLGFLTGGVHTGSRIANDDHRHLNAIIGAFPLPTGLAGNGADQNVLLCGMSRRKQLMHSSALLRRDTRLV